MSNGTSTQEPTAWTWENKWRELVALEGLRAALIEDDNLDGLEATIAEYYGWVEDREGGHRRVHCARPGDCEAERGYGIEDNSTQIPRISSTVST